MISDWVIQDFSFNSLPITSHQSLIIKSRVPCVVCCLEIIFYFFLLTFQYAILPPLSSNRIFMQEPTLREVFSASWKLTMHHKVLWILGLFALALGQLGVLDVMIGIMKGTSEQINSGIVSQIWYLFNPSTLAQIGATLNYSFDSWAALAWLLVMIFGLVVAVIVVAAIAQGGIVHAAALSIEHGLKSVEKFDESWHSGAHHASHILVLNIVKKCILFGLSLFVAAGAFAALAYGTTTSIFIFIVTFILTIVLGMTVSMLTLFAVGYLVIEDKTLFDALRLAWKLVLKHWVACFEVGIVLILFNLVIFALLFAGIYVFVIPGLALNAYGALIGSAAISQFGISMALVLFLSFAAIVGSIFTVFVTISWTYLFAIMHRWGFRSRIHAFVTGFKRS